MTSPFPGMDPFLEGDLWSDVHHELASQIRRQLMPQLSPKYVARIEKYVVEDDQPEAEVGIMYPDVDILLNKKLKEPQVQYENSATISPVSFSIPAVQKVEVRIPMIKISDVKGNRLITAIEILSPVNKRGRGLETYLSKRKKMVEAGVHFLEIDLLRRGKRTVQHPKITETDYLCALHRSPCTHIDIWLCGLKDKLPVLPVPLLKPDPDAVLDLQKALQMAYQDAGYFVSIDYKSEPPPPPVNAKWMISII